MSIQFGRWNFDGKTPVPENLEQARLALEPFAPDSVSSFTDGGIAVMFGAFHTTKESRREKQPWRLGSGAVLTWDGRLDNRSEIREQMNDRSLRTAPDAGLVAAAYERWGNGCFAKLIGDWALTVWDPVARSLILAKDPIGTRHLYYMAQPKQVLWSTILDLLVPLAQPLKLDEEYIAGWLALFPATHLTPYAGICSVPPSCFIHLQQDKKVMRQYWHFDAKKAIRYHRDAEYEDHFQDVFATSVRRRLRSDAPIVAELSGGMDSSAIVCVADRVLAQGLAETPRLDTISYYDDSEPNWDERPYFTKVEQMRGRSGTHIDVSSQQIFPMDVFSEHFAVTPGALTQPSKSAQLFSACFDSHGYRILLSGVGGDEVLGGIATPLPELADLFTQGRLPDAVSQALQWALACRRPVLHLLIDTWKGFLPAAVVGLPIHRRPPVWLNRGFIRRNRVALRGYPNRLKLFGPRPSFQSSLSTLDMIRRQLACSGFPSQPPYETRYPYLDRDLLEFLYALPPEQVVRPRQRRSLMKRSLKNVLPPEILNRARKAFVSRGPVLSLGSQLSRMLQMTEMMACEACGIVDKKSLLTALQSVKNGNEPSVVPLMRLMAVENWIRNLVACGLLQQVNSSGHRMLQFCAQPIFSAENNPNHERR
jgi:asparagine synthase (glutamine-hydrolysing)